MLNVKKKDFINLFKDRNFIIPEYQRGYVWKKNEWEDFYNDVKNILELKNTHFMGNILIKKKNDNYEIIDGQQRLITILLFIKAFEVVYKEQNNNFKIERILNIFQSKLKVNDPENIFSSILNDTFNKTIELDIESSKNIKGAYLYLKKQLVKDDFSLFSIKIKTDSKLYSVLLKLFFIEVKIDMNSNPYLIFETLNARGVELNISDLVKNHLVEQAEDKEFVRDEWRQLTNGLNGSEFEELFQYFYNSSNNKKRLLKEITGRIDSDEDVKNFIQKLSVYAQYYKNFSDITRAYPQQGVQEVLAHLNHLGSNLFKIIVIPSKVKFTNSAEFLKLLKLCEVFIFRYIVIGKKDEKSFRKKLFEIAQKINDNRITTSNRVYTELYKDFFVEDEEFENAFSYIRLTYSKRRDYRFNNQGTIVKYILYRVENYLRGDRLLSLIGTQTNDVSIEHIENDSSTNMPDAFKYRLGNYALMKESDNNQAGLDKLDFIGKKEEYYGNSTYKTIIGEENKLLSLQNMNDWSPENIKNRQRQMAQLAVNLWSLNGNFND